MLDGLVLGGPGYGPYFSKTLNISKNEWIKNCCSKWIRKSGSYKEAHKWSEIFWEPRTRKRTKSKARHESRNGIIRNPGLEQTQIYSGQTFSLISAVMSVLYPRTFSGWEWLIKYYRSGLLWWAEITSLEHFDRFNLRPKIGQHQSNMVTSNDLNDIRWGNCLYSK